MIIEILTIFPEFFDSFLNSSLLSKALESEILKVNITDIREYATDKHKTVDDTPFGGGAGMVMKIEPIDRALTEILAKYKNKESRIIMTSASGNRFEQTKAEKFSREEILIIICGRYKGIDERIHKLYPIEEISIGDYVLSGGESAAQVIIESCSRLLPGFMGKLEAAEDDSFSWNILGYPVYTQPQDYKGLKVPEVVVSGHHEKIRKYRRKMALKKTLKFRQDLLNSIALNDEDKDLLEEIDIDEKNSSK